MTRTAAAAAGPNQAILPRRPDEQSGGSGMILHDIAADTVVAVMLADGWHRVTPGSLVISPLGFGHGADLGLPGFRFIEAEAGNPYQPTVLAGPLNSVIAVRLVSPARARVSGRDRIAPTRIGPSGGRGTPQPVGTSQ